eukprot:g26978.t1
MGSIQSAWTAEEEFHQDNEDAKDALKEKPPTPAKRSKSYRQYVFDEPTADFDEEYELGSLIGAPGSFGRAHFCTHRKSGKNFAVKIVELYKYFGSAKEKVCMMLRSEYDVMKQMKHPNIIRLEGAYEDREDENLYLVMELCTGGELFDRICARTSYTERDAQVVLRAIVDGVAYMHDLKIAHCDIKPENFLFLDKREKSPIKIIDFGMAKYTDARHYLNKVAGTFNYMAPEVFELNFSMPADIWSLGVVMFVMLFGYAPFQKETAAMTKALIAKGFEPKVKSGFGPWFPEDKPISVAARDLISRMLMKDPVDRLTAREVLAHPWMLGHLASNVPLNHVLDSLPELNGDFKLRKKLLHSLAEELTEEEVTELKVSFEKLDQNGDGFLSVAELKQAANQSSDQHPALFKLMQLVQSADSDGDGKLSYSEVLMSAAARVVLAKEERMMRIFKKIDKDGSGQLSKEEIMQHLRIPKQEAEEMMEELDENKDGFISYSEFLNMWGKREMYAGIPNSQNGTGIASQNGTGA